MSRKSVITSTGLMIARGIYHLPHWELIGGHDGQTLVPAGSFIVDRDLRRSRWTPAPESGIYLCHRDVCDMPRTERFQGCCGPDGQHKNVLDPANNEPVAYEFADCWCCHYIRLARGDYTLATESPEEPQCFVGFVQYRGERHLVGAACGGTDEVALARLKPLCEEQLEAESGYTSDYYPPVESPIQTERASIYLNQLHGEQPKWLFRKY